MTPAPPPEDLERARSEAWEQGTWSERLARWRGWMAKVNHHPDTVAAQLADYERDNIALLARVAALEGERERLRSAYQDYRQRSERLVWDSIRYGGRTADETIAELERVVAKASRAEAAEAKASALEGERDDLYRRLNEASGWKDGYKLRVRALEAELAGLRGAVELTVLHFSRQIWLAGGFSVSTMRSAGGAGDARDAERGAPRDPRPLRREGGYRLPVAVGAPRP